ncbi:MAG TPA: hypothetical protein VD926_16190, partial [Acidimicrobiales bacterium]|nr:hypothetical protein [Acidimicrobiales bacterium]
MGQLSRDRVVGLTPFGRPEAAMVVGLCRAGALGLLDLGRDRAAALDALAEVCRWTDQAFGVRVGARAPVGPGDLPVQVDTVLVASAHDADRWRSEGRRVLVEARSPDEAEAAVAAGAAGLVAKGSESGGRIGDLTTFVLLQHLVDR